MRSIWTDLLFLHGHVADVTLARRLAAEPELGSKPERRSLHKQEAACPARLEASRIPPCGGGAQSELRRRLELARR